jgi:c-di-GMP-binding flagellar brake protein YcgR
VEKRTSPRFPWFAEVIVTLLPALEEASRPGQVLKAETENIAKGGIGILLDRPIVAGTVVRCDIAVSDQGVHIPTLLKVRWNNFLEGKKRYRLGLKFLL